MSYGGRYSGGRRRNFNHREDNEDERRREAVESPEQKLKSTILKFGEVDAAQEESRLVQYLRELDPLSFSTVAESLRIAVTEQPYKIPYYASLLRSLDEAPTGLTETLLGKQILDDFWKGFQAYLDKLAWREVRLCVHFFAHLTNSGVISAQSMLALLQSFTAVLDEFGVSYSRGKNAALCAAEGLMRAGLILKEFSDAEVKSIISSIQSYADASAGLKSLTSSIAALYNHADYVEGANEILDILLIVLKTLDASDFQETASSFVQPYSSHVEGSATPYFDLPSVLVPPEVIELENLTGGEDEEVPIQKPEEWPEYRVRIFDNDVTADPLASLGYSTYSAISDVIDIFEVNRKECARVLLELPKWLVPGTFKPRSSGAPENGDAATGPQWQLESCIMENILSKMFVLPRGSHGSIYYISLITELCKLQPSTVGPAVGKSIRKLYGLLGNGLDVEISRRFSEWFSIHMSNFGFQWVWKEWVPDLSLPDHHPRRNFIRRSIELEIRLSYFDRILKTLPEAYQVPDVGVIPDQAPGPEFDYDDPLRPHHDAAQSVLNLLRGRSKAEDVTSHLESLKRNIAELSDGEVNVDSVIRSVTIQSLLHIGSRSFSHFLNAIERYLPVLRNLATSPEAKADMLKAVADFWRRNKQMVFIVFDKLMQYQIVDPSDVISWAFSPSTVGSAAAIDTFRWEIIEGALDKANGRVTIAKKKVSVLRKEEDDSRARAKAIGGDVPGMEVDAEGAPVADAPAVDSPALTTALKAYSSLTKEQRAVMSKTLNEFVAVLKDTDSILNEKAWINRANWTSEDWDLWETWGWYRVFCRVYAPYLRTFSTSLRTIAFSEIESSDEVAHVLLKRVWNIATGQEV